MIRISFITAVLLLTLTGVAQKAEVLPGDPAFDAKYAAYDFKGQIAAVVCSDAASNYYLVDFSRLPSRFERVYFMDLSFSSGKLVNMDPDIRKDKLWFKSLKGNTEKEILTEFNKILDATSGANRSWTDARKSEWLKNNDKYLIEPEKP